MAVDPAGFHGAVRAAGRPRRGRVDPSRASSGSCRLHNILASGYQGAVHGWSREPGDVLGVPVVADIDDLPDDAIDLVFVCTPAAANPDLLRACAKKGIRAAFLASAGYGEAGEEGQRLQAELVALADELGMLVAGPNGQGVVSTPASLCAQIVAPYPPAGRDRHRLAVGQLHLVVHELRRADGRRREPGGVGGQRRGRHHPRLPRLLRRATTPPRSALAYVEGVPDGRAFFERTRAVGGRKPLVIVKGGATAGGQRAAAQPHRLAGQRRPRLRRHVPSGRHHPRRHDRGGVRGGRHLRHPAAPEGQPRRRADHRRRVGRRHRRRDQPLVARAHARCRTTCAPRSTRSSRRAGAATTPSTWPAARPATRSPRCSTSSSATPTSTR